MTRLLTSRPVRIAAAAAVVVAASFSALGGAWAMPGGMGRPGHGPDGGPGLPMMMGSPAQLDRMLDGVGASAEQRQQVRTIVEAAAKDLRAQHDGDRQLREQGMQLFQAPTVDARAAETWRQQMLARHDQASQRMVQAMLDVARVLTPEQRKQLGDRMAQHQAMMERHRAEREAIDRPTR